ncbi:hypothetical protein EYF88_12120 [Paracoccus sediminis]|uniref:Uncharacterized protein n=1 Tax=Paracoccus sediminis TaxID=1214787 RepID=A0ABY1YIA5_9RHOB|nr:hypothetical protein [Paracoccus sediminis]TBN49314.1 hypothetical protein EYF88_12120 [Paracoccus sediminis]
MNWISLFAVVTLATPVASHAWEFELIEGRGAGTIRACAATRAYRNGFFTVRLYGEQMDFVMANDELALPYGQMLGPIAIVIGPENYVGVAYSFDKDAADAAPTTSVLQIVPIREEYEKIFDGLRFGSEATVIFPNGDNYAIDLVGSSQALGLASECWRQTKTGPNNKNPFEVPEGGNPFEATPRENKNPFEKPA